MPAFLADENQVMPQVFNVFFQHVLKCHLPAFGMNAGSQESRIGQGSQYRSSHHPVFLKHFAGNKGVELIGTRQQAKCSFVVAAQERVVHTGDSL